MKLSLLLIAVALKIVSSWAPSSLRAVLRPGTRVFRSRTSLATSGAEGELPPMGAELTYQTDDLELKEDALMQLDLMLAPTDVNDPEYDFSRDQKRKEFLSSFTYESLKKKLRQRGLHSAGAKETMLIRLLMHVIDPDMKFIDGLDGGVELSYITEEDIKNNNIRVLTDEEIELEKDTYMGPDCDDLRVLRRRPDSPISTKDLTDRGPLSITNFVVGRKLKPFQLLDGLERYSKAVDTVQVFRSRDDFRLQDQRSGYKLLTYVVHPKVGMRSMRTSFPYIILLPHESGWTSKHMRSLADELCYQTQFPVIMPNIYRGRSAQDVLDIGMRREQVADDLLAVSKFVSSTYGYDIFSLAGVGIGGGLALQCAVDLQTLSVLGITEGLCVEMGLTLQQVLHNSTARDVLVSSDVAKAMLPRYNPFLRRPSYYEGVLAEAQQAINLNETKLVSPKEEKVDKELHDIEDFLEVLTAEELRAEEATETEEEEEPEEAVFSDFTVSAKESEEVEEDAPKVGLGDGDKLSVTASDEELAAMMEEAAQEMSGEYGMRNRTATEGEDEKKEETLEEKQAKAELGRKHYYDDWKAIFKLIQSTQQQSTTPTEEELTSSNTLLISGDCLQPLKSFVNVAPRSCLALAPNRFDLHQVSEHTLLPTMVVSTAGDTSPGGTLDVIQDLHRSFGQRREEIMDFLFRVYRQITTSVLVEPARDDDEQRRAFMDAVIVGGAWLSAFNVRSSRHLVGTAGLSKQADRMNFLEVEPRQLLRYNPSILATHLHDDPAFVQHRP